jgi:hypothetical protein
MPAIKPKSNVRERSFSDSDAVTQGRQPIQRLVGHQYTSLFHCARVRQEVSTRYSPLSAVGSAKYFGFFEGDEQECTAGSVCSSCVHLPQSRAYNLTKDIRTSYHDAGCGIQFLRN